MKINIKHLKCDLITFTKMTIKWVDKWISFELHLSKEDLNVMMRVNIFALVGKLDLVVN